LKFPRAALALILFASVQFACSAGLFAQTPSPTPEPMDVKISFSPGQEVTLPDSGGGGSEQGIVPAVTLLPNQQVTVTLQFSSDKVGAPVLIGTYDSGEISGIDNPVVPGDGAVPFTFQPGDAPGAYRVLVQVGDEQHLLQFWVKAPEE
jgi:hypothetical protein